MTKKLVALKWPGEQFDPMGFLFYIPSGSDLPVPIPDEYSWLTAQPELQQGRQLEFRITAVTPVKDRWSNSEERPEMMSHRVT